MPFVYIDFEIKEIEILVDDFTQNTNLLLEADSSDKAITITDKKKQYLRSLLIDIINTIKPKMNQVIFIYSNSENEKLKAKFLVIFFLLKIILLKILKI